MCAAMALPALSMAVGKNVHDARDRLSHTLDELDQLDQILAESARLQDAAHQNLEAHDD